MAGFIGSIPIAVVANRTKALTSITKLANGLGVVFAIFMMEVSVPLSSVAVHDTPAFANQPSNCTFGVMV